jgi:hypothetical protein
MGNHEMNARIENLRVNNNIIDNLPFLDRDSIEWIIAAAIDELRERDDEERAKQEYIDEHDYYLLARQDEADQVDDFLLQGSMLYGRTNALEGIK